MYILFVGANALASGVRSVFHLSLRKRGSIDLMAITVRVPMSLRTLTQNRDEVQGDGATVRALLDDLDARNPGLRDRLLDEKGVRRFINIYLNDEDIRFLDGLDTALNERDSLTIIPAIAGGR
jgi:molybdopterin converting factor small subunit